MEIEKRTDDILESVDKRNRNWEKIEQDKIKLQADNVILRKELSDTKKSLSTINANQEATQVAQGYGVVSLPKTAGEGHADFGIKGLTATNLIKNGDFRDGLMGWGANNASISLLDGSLKAVCEANGHARVSVEVSLDDMYYMSAFITSVSTEIGIGLSGYSSFKHSGGSGLVSGVWKSVFNAETTFRVLGSPTKETELLVDGVKLINLTQTFGAGNEPTKEECDVIFSNYFDGTKSTISASRLKSVGKNLIDTSKFELGYIENGKGLFLPHTSYYAIKQYFEVFEGVVYSFKNIIGSYSMWYDANKTAIYALGGADGGGSALSRTAPAGAKYLRVTSASSNQIATAQVERGTVATPYEPYTESTQYLPNVGELRSLPNGVADEIVNGELVKRVMKAKLTKNMIRGYTTVLANVDLIEFNLTNLVDIVAQTSTDLGSVFVKGKIETFGAERDKLESVGKFYTNASTIALVVKKGEFSSLENAKLNFLEVDVSYQLATPITHPIQTSGSLIAYPSGTVYIEQVVADAGLYTDKFTVLGLPIKTIDKLSKIEFTSGTETKLDVSKAVVSGTTFTHPNLMANDVVFVEYYYTGESTNPSTSLEFYDSRYTIKDSVTDKFYKWNVKIANGVATLGTEEV